MKHLLFAMYMGIFAAVCAPQKVSAQSVTLTELIPAVSVHTSEYSDIAANGLVYVSGNEAAIVDTPWTEAQTGELIDLLEARGLNVVAVIPTHWHDDCMGGLAVAQRRGIPTYGLAMTADIARDKGLPVPENTFTGTLSIQVGDSKVACRYFGGGHSADNIVVWVPEERVLFGGCLIKTMRATGMGNLADAVVEDWPGTVQKVIDAYPDVRIVVPGHGPHGDSALLTHTLDVVGQHSE